MTNSTSTQRNHVSLRSNALRTKPISPHFINDSNLQKLGKNPRPLGDPVSFPKPYPSFIAPPPTNLVNLSLSMDVILPEEEKNSRESGLLVFHALGDTGGINGDYIQKAISDAMDTQISTDIKDNRPQFFYHLGDVVYFNGESSLYGSQFYEPYQNYHAPIFAIPGNHDGDTHTRTGDPVDTESSLFGFMRNFCDATSS